MVERRNKRRNKKRKKKELAVIVFTRVPIPGQTKTRMMPYLSSRQCACLHSCFLKDIRNSCMDVQADVFVCYTPEGKEGVLYPLTGEDAVYFPQEGEGLGERMYHAIETVLKKGYQACVLIGTDVPEIRADHLTDAFAMLEAGHDVVFGPTVDGGYYLVGMRRPYREVFEKQTYGYGNVLENTIRRLKEQKFKVGCIERLQDMDTREDLQGYRERMRRNPQLKRTETGRYLMRTSRISVIVPVYNEEKMIVRMQEQLKPYQNKCEILFVDGGSTDRTLELSEPGFRIIRSKKGRANQMNLGARESHGDILFFLHCDSELPDHFLEHIRCVMKDYRAGCFGVAFHSGNFFMWTCRVISNHRIKDRKVMFGDQGIFIDRELFFEVGMFPELPIMEDYQLSLTLKEKGVKLGIAGKRIYTSDRRFPKGTVPKLKVMWKMNRLRKMYRDGVAADEIARMYEDIR